MAQQNPIDIIYQRAIQGKTQEQRENISYMFNKPLVAGGCFSSAQYMTDDEYFRRIDEKKKSLGLYARAVEQIGLDPEELQEIPPVCLENFVFNDAWTKTTQSGLRVSSSYQVSWIFFSAEQIYLYQYTMYMDEDKKREDTEEYFYQDVTAFVTKSQSEKAKNTDGTTVDVETTKLGIVVPGTTLMVAVNDTDSTFRNSVKAMKFKLREKKNG